MEKYRIISERSETNWEAYLNKPLFDIVREDNRIALSGYLVEVFGLSIDDIKFNTQSLSNNYIVFSKIYGQTWVNVSIGLEMVSCRIAHPETADQIIETISKIHNIYTNADINEYNVEINVHYSFAGNLEKYLSNFYNCIPNAFEDCFDGGGIIYGLGWPKEKMKCHVVLSKSLVVDKGIYLATNFKYSPDNNDYNELVKAIKDRRDFVLSGLKLVAEEG